MGSYGAGLNADKVSAVISHQVANYGMGGQYEPHFDFSRVSPPSLVVLKGSALAGLMSVELLEAFQLSRHPFSGKDYVVSEAPAGPSEASLFPVDVRECLDQ